MQEFKYLSTPIWRKDWAFVTLNTGRGKYYITEDEANLSKGGVKLGAESNSWYRLVSDDHDVAGCNRQPPEVNYIEGFEKPCSPSTIHLRNVPPREFHHS